MSTRPTQWYQTANLAKDLRRSGDKYVCNPGMGNENRDDFGVKTCRYVYLELDVDFIRAIVKPRTFLVSNLAQFIGRIISVEWEIHFFEESASPKHTCSATTS